MAEQRSICRRTALRTLGTVATTVAGASGGVAAVSQSSTDRTAAGPATDDKNANPPAIPEPPEEQVSDGATASDETSPESGLTGIYGGTVDRVVGGEHVVVLIETAEETVGQEIVPAAEFPSLEARDSVIVWMLFGTLVYLWPV